MRFLFIRFGFEYYLYRLQVHASIYGFGQDTNNIYKQFKIVFKQFKNIFWVNYWFSPEAIADFTYRCIFKYHDFFLLAFVSSAHIMEKVQIPLPWLSCLSVCRWRKRRCARLFPSRSLSSCYRKGHVAIFPSSSLLHARTTRPISPCSPRFFVTMHAFSTVPKFRFQAVVY